MQSTGHSSTHALSFTSIQGSAMTYAMGEPFPVAAERNRATGYPARVGSVRSAQNGSSHHGLGLGLKTSSQALRSSMSRKRRPGSSASRQSSVGSSAQQD